MSNILLFDIVNHIHTRVGKGRESGTIRFGISPLASDCSTKISYSVQASTAAGGFAGLTPEQISASGTLSDSFFLGNAYAPKTPVLIQVAYPLPFKLPYIGTILTKSGTNSVLASAAVLAEPYQ